MSLVLTRKIGESIIIGDDVVVRVMAIQGGSVRLGIDAPPEVAVDREEIRQRKENDGSDGGPVVHKIGIASESNET
jgi:carbon storage regulator